MKRLIFVASMMLATILMVSPTLADSPPYGRKVAAAPDEPIFNYSGVYLDVATGRGVTMGEVSDLGPFNIDSLAGDGWRGQVRVGIDWHVGQSPFLVGLFAGYGIGESEFNTDIGLINLLNSTLTPTWHLGGRVGLVSGRGLFYVGGAWQQADFDVSWASDGGRDGFSQTVDGWKALVGIEYALAPNWVLGLEYGHTWYGSVGHEKIENTRIDLRDNEVLLRVKWKPLTGLFN